MADKGIRFVIGRPKRSTKTDVQSVLFNSRKWTVARAKKWLKDNGFKYGSVDKPTGRGIYFRFRQRDPGEFQKRFMRTIVPGETMKNPKKKQVRSAAQKRATRRMIAARKKALAAAKKNPSKKPGKKKVSKKKTVARKKKASTRKKDRRYYIQSVASKRYFDGFGCRAKTRKGAASFTDKATALEIAQEVSNESGRRLAVVS